MLFDEGAVEMKKSFRGLRIERLEDRSMMAGGGFVTYPMLPVSLAPQVQVNNLYIAPMTVLPGSSNVTLSKFTLGTAGRTYAQIVSGTTQFVVLPGVGESLAGNVESMILRVDADGKASNGCEKTIAYGQPNWETGGMVIFTANESLWIRNTPMMAEIVANRISPNPTGDTISVELAGVFQLRDMGGKEVSADTIKYGGANTVVHSMMNHVYQISQIGAKEFASVSPWETHNLLEFSGWGNSASLKSVCVSVTNPGNITPNTFMLVQDNNWDGIGDAFYTGSTMVLSTNTSLVTFNLGNGVSNGAKFSVTGYTAQHAMTDNTFSVALVGMASAVDNTTGAYLKGTIMNGNGAGQIQFWTCASTKFALVEKPSLVITGGELRPNTYVQPTKVVANQEVVVASFDVKNTDSTFVSINLFELTAKIGDVRNFSSYTLWVYDISGAKINIGSGSANNNSIFVSTVSPPAMLAGKTTRYEVTAVATPLTVTGQNLQVKMTPAKLDASNGTKIDAIKKIFFMLGDNPWYTFDDIGGMG